AVAVRLAVLLASVRDRERTGHVTRGLVRAKRALTARGERDERDALAEQAAALVVAALGERQALIAAGRADVGLHDEPRAAPALVAGGGEQRVDVHTACGPGRRAVASALPDAVVVGRRRRISPYRVALSDRHRDHVVADPAARPRRNFDLSVRRLDREQVPGRDAERLRNLVACLGPPFAGR